MITWIREDAGVYKSDNGRFDIMKTYDRVYGTHWQLHDNNASNYYKGTYDEQSLRECKAKAEAILSREKV